MTTEFYRQHYKEAVAAKANLNEMVHRAEREHDERPFASKVCESCGEINNQVKWKRDKVEAKRDCFIYFFLCPEC